ncbi:hypothetical protein CYMTET_11849 [Cymbomonas tetramitiformis]|uniref:Uncharacterized protein n=1 Tax=Cymbomonas tetramitiformis TaxID=36881 RepID=A0AAE0GLS9_9CHLO|nr:hypothetical protein CYMTET_11849 [Cymbomonas tetramitiformis]
MAEYNLRNTVAARNHPDSEDEAVIPPSVLTLWTKPLHATRNSTHVDSATLRGLYGKGATPSLVEAAQQHVSTDSWQAPYRGAGLGVEIAAAPAICDTNRPVQFVRAGTFAHAAATADTHHARSLNTPADLLAAEHPLCLTAALSAAAGARETREPTTDEAMIQWLQGERV